MLQKRKVSKATHRSSGGADSRFESKSERRDPSQWKCFYFKARESPTNNLKVKIKTANSAPCFFKGYEPLGYQPLFK